MIIDVKKIKSGLQHFKQMMSRSRHRPDPLPSWVKMPVEQSGATMNPLGGMPPPPVRRPLPRIPNVPPHHHQPVVEQLYSNNPPLVRAASATRFYMTNPNDIVLNVNQAPPPSQLPSLSNQLASVVNSSPSDASINDALESAETEADNSGVASVPGPLAVQQDLKLYEDFLAIESLRTSVPENQPGLKNLATGEYAVEAGNEWHKSAFLMSMLIAYYRKNYLDKNIPLTFSQVITTLTAMELKTIWRSQSDNETHEFIRRFLQGVRYLDPQKRQKYNVTSNGGQLYWAKWGNQTPLDTESPEFFKRKHEDNPVFSRDKAAIWVLSKDDRLYTHASKLHRFHHSSFTSGDLIRCGGDWHVKSGKLQWISAMSGHYRPRFEDLRNAIQILANKFSINANSYKVKLFGYDNAFKKVEKLIPASKFLFDFKAVQDNYMLI